MIVRMKRLTLLGLKSEKDSIFDAIVRSNAVQLKRAADVDSQPTAEQSQAREKVLADVARVEDAIAFVSQTAEQFNLAHKKDKDSRVKVPKNSFSRPKAEIDFDYFLGFGEHVGQIELSLTNLAQLRERTSELSVQKVQKQTEIQQLELYRNLPHPTAWYHGTETSLVFLAQIPSSEMNNLLALAEQFSTVSLEVFGENAGVTLIAVALHKSQQGFVEKATALGLVKSNLVTDVLPCAMLEALERQTNGITEQIAACQGEVAAYAADIPSWKVYADFLLLREKKLAADGDMHMTDSVFVMEGYYPAESENDLRERLQGVTQNLVMDFADIPDGEFAPTLTRNNKFTEPFEFVTNSYSAPDYREIDPNPVMSVFYFVIFGLMVADIGYGALLVAAGLFATFAIKQKTGMKVMLQMFGICGISAIVVGVLFGSVFGYTIWDKIFPDPTHPIHNGIIPNPADFPMVMMIISLLFGVVHLAAGIGCNMAVKIKHKQYLAAWLTDFPWIIVFAGFVLAIFNSALDMAAYQPYEVLRLPPIVGQIGLYVCLAALAVALVCAGLGTKGFLGKVIKSFGSAYGIINYFSDIMSYIRVFGLMLSSAIMATVVNQLGAMVSGSGGFGYVLAALVLVFAHLFNLVMGILSVYIHNGRLQYVEFFGKFYTGDGQLFVPFGSDTRYTLVK